MIWTSPIVGQGSGKLGGVVVYMSRSGLAIRARVKGANPNSTRQQIVRMRTATISEAWRNLSESERNTWISAASEMEWTNKLGLTFTPSGYDLFMQRNYNLFKIGLTTLLNEYVSVSELPERTIDSVTLDTSANTFGIRFTPGAMADSWRWFFQTSPPQSPGRRSRRLLRETAIWNNSTLYVNIWTKYKTTWATLNPGETVALRATIVDQNSGYELERGWWFITAE